jgi:phage terminase large subunit GpA-like protein
MDPDLIPVIREVMSHSKWGISWFTGTPKTEDNAIEKQWQRSSQAEWFIKCEACNHYNIPHKDYDLVKMIGPVRDDISEERPAVVCAKCSRPVQPRKGRWVHQRPERR